MPNAETTWNVTASPSSYSPPGWAEFTFGTWTPWWFGDDVYARGGFGATDGFIRRPFLYLGFWYGLAAGALALGLTLAAGWALDERLRPLLTSYDSRFELQGPDLMMVLALLASSAILGWLGARLATGHHLRQTRPTDL